MADYTNIAKRLLQEPTEIAQAAPITAQTLVRDPMYNDPVPARGSAVMKPWEPKYVTDNIAPMVSDAASAVGVPSTVANRLGREAGTAAAWSPPGALVDAAGDIGGAVHRGDTKGAILNAGAWNMARMLAGPVYRGAAGVLPTQARRDAMQSAYRDTLPGEAIGRLPIMTPGMDVARRSRAQSAEIGAHRAWFDKQLAPSNVNSRANMRPALGVVE